MRVPEREQRTLDGHGQEERRPRGQVANVHVAALGTWRDDGVIAERRWRKTDRADERHHGETKSRQDLGSALSHPRDAQVRLLEDIGEQSEAWNVGRPAPGIEIDREDLDHQGIARFRPAHLDWSRDWIDACEIEGGDIRHGGVPSELAAGRVRHLQTHRGAGIHHSPWPLLTVPREVRRIARNMERLQRPTSSRQIAPTFARVKRSPLSDVGIA